MTSNLSKPGQQDGWFEASIFSPENERNYFLVEFFYCFYFFLLREQERGCRERGVWGGGEDEGWGKGGEGGGALDKE